MGYHPNITATKFPRQGSFLNKRVQVCFRMETSKLFPATVVRDDAEDPFLTIIRLDNGKVVLGSECQYTDSFTD
jgi:hypothetical protein